MPLVATRGAASAQGFGEFAQSGPVTYIEDVFSVDAYTGNSTGFDTTTITNGVNLSAKGGLVWVKQRDSGTFSTFGHAFVDSARGLTKILKSNSTNGEVTISDIMSSFNTNGYTLAGSGYTNNLNDTYVGWAFRKQPKFFDIVTYTGNGVSGRTISHNLGSEPGCVIVKSMTTNGYQWAVYHRSIGNTGAIFLDSTEVTSTSASYWNNTTPTSTNFTVGTSGYTNANGEPYVAYVFAHNAGGFGLTGSDNVISCGSFSGATFPLDVNLGYEPQYLLIKSASSVSTWWIFDNIRGLSALDAVALRAETANIDQSLGSTYVDITSTGFKLGTSAGGLGLGTTNIYIAIRRGPMKTPTSGTSVYNSITWTGNGATGRTLAHGLSSPPDLSIAQWRDGSQENVLWDKLRGFSTTAAGISSYLRTPSTGGEGLVGNYYYIPDMVNVAFGSVASSGIQLNGSGITLVSWNFRRAPSFFDVVCWTRSANTQTLNHNLGVTPELIIKKDRSRSTYWQVMPNVSPYDYRYEFYLNDTQAISGPSTMYWNAAPTSTTFDVNMQFDGSSNGDNFVAYLFATVSGVSKVGSYTGTGALQTVNCGFTGGARFVLIKRTDSTGDWWVYDSVRGISSINDPYLFLNSSAVEVTNTNYVDTTSVGFQVTASAPAGLNANGGTYLFLAIA